MVKYLEPYSRLGITEHAQYRLSIRSAYCILHAPLKKDYELCRRISVKVTSKRVSSEAAQGHVISVTVTRLHDHPV
jgi:hypothetical protein